jgi:hypothetical protein
VEELIARREREGRGVSGFERQVVSEDPAVDHVLVPASVIDGKR